MIACVAIVLFERLRTIPVEHMDLPAQAMACCIADIEPANTELGWSHTDISEFSKISPKYLRALVKVRC